MANSVLRVTDRDSSDHQMTEGSPNVTANNLAVCRQGDKDSNDDIITTFSSKVFVNGKGVARSGDKDSNNDTESSNSNVVCGCLLYTSRCV